MKKQEKLTIITAFFDIGRATMDYDNCEPRSFERYLTYFEDWARVRNDVIVYAQKGFGDKILAVREKFGLGEKTKIVEIDDVFAIESELLARMEKVEEDKGYLDFRFFSSEVSNTAKYNYVMLMKYYFLKDASEKYVKDGDLAWIDLGFNHGGDCYSKPEEFDFELKNKSTTDKVQLFALPGKNIEKINPVRSLQYQSEHIHGAPIVCPAAKSAALYKECIDAMDALLRVGCMDDDQQLLLMAVRNNPDLFEVKTSFWFMPIKDYLGGDHLSVKPAFQNKANGGKRKDTTTDKLRRMKWRMTGGKYKKEVFLARQKKIANEEWPDAS